MGQQQVVQETEDGAVPQPLRFSPPAGEQPGSPDGRDRPAPRRAQALSRGDHRRLSSRRSPEHRRSLRSGRTGSVHTVVGAMLAVIALVGCVIAILLLATQPTATRLEHEVTALTHRLSATQGELTALKTTVGRSAAQHATLTRDISRLTSRVAGLQRTVHGLQSSTTLTQQQAAGLRACVPQLQQELAGLTLRTRSVGGQLRSVGLSDGTLLSPACQAVFSGL
ncbi:MAG TPA: hypothetical protein VE127_13055 [Solirubrobacteraceae bacterium]|nr:hypothetical protein [Solirubrobacteraceae bacterium]